MCGPLYIYRPQNGPIWKMKWTNNFSRNCAKISAHLVCKKLVLSASDNSLNDNHHGIDTMHYDALEYTSHSDHNVDTPNRVNIVLPVYGLSEKCSIKSN